MSIGVNRCHHVCVPVGRDTYFDKCLYSKDLRQKNRCHAENVNTTCLLPGFEPQRLLGIRLSFRLTGISASALESFGSPHGNSYNRRSSASAKRGSAACLFLPIVTVERDSSFTCIRSIIHETQRFRSTTGAPTQARQHLSKNAIALTALMRENGE